LSRCCRRALGEFRSSRGRGPAQDRYRALDREAIPVEARLVLATPTYPQGPAPRSSPLQVTAQPVLSLSLRDLDNGVVRATRACLLTTNHSPLTPRSRGVAQTTCSSGRRQPQEGGTRACCQTRTCAAAEPRGPRVASRPGQQSRPGHPRAKRVRTCLPPALAGPRWAPRSAPPRVTAQPAPPRGTKRREMTQNGNAGFSISH